MNGRMNKVDWSVFCDAVKDSNSFLLARSFRKDYGDEKIVCEELEVHKALIDFSNGELWARPRMYADDISSGRIRSKDNNGDTRVVCNMGELYEWTDFDINNRAFLKVDNTSEMFTFTDIYIIE